MQSAGRRWFNRGALLVLLLLGLSLLVRQAGFYLQAPAEAPQKSDLIVSLGGDIGERSEKVAELYRAGFGGKVLLTGIAGSPPGPRQQFLDWRAQYLVAQGVPADSLLLDAAANNSWEEAAAVLQLMRERGWKRVLVVSEPPHLRRLSWTWSRVFEGSGLEFRLIASPMTEWHPDAWWHEERSGIFVITEYLKLAYYVAKRR
jgi:uncharacterized SAM-binding protein YcdF (DUF218 family)